MTPTPMIKTRAAHHRQYHDRLRGSQRGQRSVVDHGTKSLSEALDEVRVVGGYHYPPDDTGDWYLHPGEWIAMATTNRAMLRNRTRVVPRPWWDVLDTPTRQIGKCLDHLNDPPNPYGHWVPGHKMLADYTRARAVFAADNLFAKRQAANRKNRPTTPKRPYKDS